MNKFESFGYLGTGPDTCLQDLNFPGNVLLCFRTI